MSGMEKLPVYGVKREKLPSEPVYPNTVRREELVKGLWFELIELKSEKSFEYFKSIDVEIEDLGEEHLNLKSLLVRLSLLDFYEMAQLMDAIKSTKTYVNKDEGTAKVLPGEGHSGVGFYPLEMGETVRYKKLDGSYGSAIVASPIYEEDGTLEVRTSVDSESVYIDPLSVARL